MTTLIISRFLERAGSRPDDPFLIHPEGRVLTYGQAAQMIAQMSGLFRSLGVHVGDRIALQAEKCEASLLAYLAALHAGAVFLPLNPAYTPEEVAYFLSDARPAIFICREGDQAALAGACAGAQIAQVLTIDPAQGGSLAARAGAFVGDLAPAARTLDDLAAILYTSGTTGRSKGAMLSQRNLASNADILMDLWGFTAADRLLHALPIFHTHGLFVATNITIAAGSAMLFLNRFDVGEIVELLPQASCMMGVPTFYTRLLADPRLTRDLVAQARLFISGSAPLSAETHREFQERTGHAILERYGMTETNMNTSNPYHGARKPGSVGLPLPGVDLRITELETGRVLPQGEIGGLEVRGPNVFGGYWRMPEKTAEDFRADGFFITGDLGFVDADGYVHISGRAKDLIISGGFNIYPAEIEAVLDAIPGVAESAVIGVPDRDLGEAVVAVVALSEPDITEDQIIAGLAGRLARFKQPRRICLVGALPRNTMGKVQKKQLREAYANLMHPPAG